MIVKNEAQRLPRCLSSVKGLVDEMIIVDTGSTDNTVNIAKDYGARVFNVPWNNDFSESRNHALKYATGDWILHLDADEELVKEDAPLIKQIIKNKDINGVYCMFYSSQKDSLGHSQFNLPRLYRNNIGVTYRGRIHETPIIPGKISFSNIRIIHHGYALDKTTTDAKKRRNAEILMQELNKNPKDVALHFYLAKNYYEQGLYELTLEEGREVLRILPCDFITKKSELISFLEIYLIMAYSHYNRGEYQEAEQLCSQAIALKPNYIDPHFFLGHMYLLQGKCARSVECFQKYLQIREHLEKNPEFNHLVIYSLTKSHEAYAGLGTAYGKLGNYIESINQFKKAIHTCPEYAEAYNGLGVIYGCQGNVDEAVACFKNAMRLSPHHVESYKNLGIVYATQGKLLFAVETLEKAININPNVAELHNNLGVVFARKGKFEDAIQSFKKAIEIDPRYTQASDNLMLARKKLQS